MFSTKLNKQIETKIHISKIRKSNSFIIKNRNLFKELKNENVIVLYEFKFFNNSLKGIYQKETIKALSFYKTQIK